MLDKSKIATLVRSQSALPRIPAKKPGAPAAAAKPPAKPGAKPAKDVKPAGPPNLDDMTPQEIAALVEEAATEAEGQKDVELEDLLVDYMHGDTNQPPAWASDAEKWQRAMEAVGIGTPNEERYEEPYAVVAYAYKKMGGGLAAAGQPPVDGEAPAPAAGPKPPPKPAEAAPAKPPAGPPAKKPVAPPGEEAPPAAEDGGGDLKQMLDEAANQAQTQPDPQLAELVAGYDPARDGSPPTWALDGDKWSKAEAAVKPHWGEYEAPLMVVAHVYKNMGGGVQ